MDDERKQNDDGSTNQSRRTVALSLLGALGGAAFLKGCAPGSAVDIEDVTDDTDPATIAAALTGSAMRWFDTIAELAASAGSTNHEVAFLLGYHSVGDGGGGMFYWDLGSTASDDGGTIVAASGGRWRRSFSGKPCVEWWGARGDGTSNDHVPLTNAIVYCQARSMTLALGTGRVYYCDATLGVACSVDGEGATIKGNVNITTSGIRLTNLTIYSDRALALYISGISPSNRLSNVTIDEVVVTYQAGITSPAARDAINAAYVHKLIVRNCRLLYGTNLVDCPHFLFSGNICDGENQNESELLHITLKSFGIVNGNLFTRSMNDPMDLYSSGERTIISNNRFDGCKSRYGVCLEIKITLRDPTEANRSSDENGWCEEIVVANNVFTDLRPFAAHLTNIINVMYVDDRGEPAFSWANTVRNVIITGNIVEGWDDSAISGTCLFNAIRLSGANGCVVSNNIVRNIKTSVQGAASALTLDTVTSCTITGNKLSTDDGQGIVLRREVSDCTFVGNVVGTDPHTGESCFIALLVDKDGADPAATVDGCSFSGNVLYGSVASFRSAAAAGALTDCTFSGNHFKQSALFEHVTRCGFVNNNFFGNNYYVASLGYAAGVSQHNRFVGNTLRAGASVPNLQLYRMRAAAIKDNITTGGSWGMLVGGTNATGELDRLTIKDNLSVSQSNTDFPYYVSMSSGDTTTLVADNNVKTT